MTSMAASSSSNSSIILPQVTNTSSFRLPFLALINVIAFFLFDNALPSIYLLRSRTLFHICCPADRRWQSPSYVMYQPSYRILPITAPESSALALICSVSLSCTALRRVTRTYPHVQPISSLNPRGSKCVCIIGIQLCYRKY